MIISPHKDNHLLAMPGTLGDGNFAKLSALPGYSKWQDRNLIFRVTGENIRHFITHWPDAEWIGGTEEHKAAYTALQAKAEEIIKTKNDDGFMPDVSDYRFEREPMDHQRKAFGISRDADSFGLFMEQGTGKSKVTIDTGCYLYAKGKIDAMIVVAWPNGVHRNWIDYELPEDMSVPYVADYWSSNYSAKYRQEDYKKILNAKGVFRVFGFNVEAFVGKSAREMILKMLTQWRCLLVIDQSASIKNPQAIRTKFLIDKCSRVAAYRRVLDGAPVAEGADELYSQFKFLDPKIIGHDTWTGFKAEFCVIGFFNEISGYRNMDELRRRIDGHCYRVLADDCLDLPTRIYKVWPFDLSPREAEIFDDLKGKDLAFFKSPKDKNELEDLDGHEHLEEHRALIKNLRLQQIASGWWPGEEFKMIEEDGVTSRVKALLTLLEQAPGKALIFSRFRADLDIIQTILGKKAVSYHGGISEEDRATAKKKFMTDPKTLYFVGQPRSAGIGHTLTAAHHVIFFSNDASLRMREECEKRAHRKGLKNKLIIWDLIARGTHDMKIVKALREKKEIANMIMQDPKNFFLCHEK